MRKLPYIFALTGILTASGVLAQEVSTTAAQPSGEFAESPSIELVQVASGLSDPVGIVSSPDGSGRLFVLERSGVVRVIENADLREEPFLDLSDDVLSAFLEQGLYDLAFHPEFAENGIFFVHFAELMRNGDSVVVRYRVSGEDANRADPESARLILQIDQPYANHNGGELAFGPDGYLYIGSGDGGWEGDPLEAGQDLSTLLGKLLRIDVAPALIDADPHRDYAIPPDNPFARDPELVRLFGLSEEFFADIHTQARPEIWAYGLRNPWKFSFDPETGDLWLPDVGQNEWEEINFQPANADGGTNYGWDFLMGTHCFPIQEESCAEVGRLPVAEYSHDVGCAVIDIGVIRDPALSELSGTYLAGDYCAGTIWGLARADNEGWRMGELLKTTLRITGSGRGEDGVLYVTACECHYGGGGEPTGGTVWRVVPAGQVPEGANTAPKRTEPYDRHQHQGGGGQEQGDDAGREGHHQNGGTGGEGSGGDEASSNQGDQGHGHGEAGAESEDHHQN
jgi:glucose/arabinose dehydrogenase